MKKLLVTTLLVCLVLSVVAMPAAAEEPMEVSGYFDYFIDLGSLVARQAGPNTFLYGTDEEDWFGDIQGHVPETEFVVRMYGTGRQSFMSYFELTGTVLGSDEGTLLILLNGKKDAPDQDWHGQWVILGGGGGLANAHGQGEWWGPGMNYDPLVPDLYYKGQVHFDP